MSGHAPRGLGASWEGVSFAYPSAGELGHGTAGQVDAVRGITLSVAAGESLALLGPNGAGKTTLTRMLVGLVRPREGSVRVGDWDVAGRRPDQMAARVGYAFQHADHQLFARTVWQDVAFGPRRLGLGVGHVDALLEELRLAAFAGRHPYDLPAPLRKMVSLAGVLAMRTPLLVLDEPTAGFDGELRSLAVEALGRRLAEGVTLVAISHDERFVEALARRRITLEEGLITSDSH